jgi:hypothetical protein
MKIDDQAISLEPPYTFDKMRDAKPEELVREINRQLEVFEASKDGGSDRALYALRAQFIMQEVSRRDQNRQARIMIACTIAITVMTVAITVMTWLSLSCGH